MGFSFQEFQTNDIKINKENIHQGIIFYNDFIFKDKTVPINLWTLDNEKEILSMKNLHAHEYIQICYVNKGIFRHFIGDTGHIMVKGDVFVIPPLVKHGVEMIEGQEGFIYELEFAASFINENFASLNFNSGLFDFAYIEPFLVAENRVKPRLNLSDEAQIKIEDIMQEMQEEMNRRSDGYKHYLKADLLKVLVLIGREYAKSRETNEEEDRTIKKYKSAMLNTIRYINDNYTCDLKLEDVCRYSMMSQAYFSNFFKQITKKTFTEYINDLRIKKAMQLIKDGKSRITDICYEVGFNDAVHFNRVFKKVTGVSPTIYKKIL